MISEIKSASLNSYERLRLILFQLEHILSDYKNDIPKNKIGPRLNEQFSELVKSAQAIVYDATEFCCKVNECVYQEDLEYLLNHIANPEDECKAG